MENKNLVMQIDSENGIKIIPLVNGDTKKSVSVSNDGSKFLDELGADVVLHFDEKNQLLSIELIGL